MLVEIEAPVETSVEIPVSTPEQEEKAKAAELLLETADLLEQEGGWIQGSMTDGYGYCLIGGLTHKQSNLRLPYSVYFKAQDALCNSIGGTGWRHYRDRQDKIINWNDTHNRRKDTVLRKLREAAWSLLG